MLKLPAGCCRLCLTYSYARLRDLHLMHTYRRVNNFGRKRERIFFTDNLFFHFLSPLSNTATKVFLFTSFSILPWTSSFFEQLSALVLCRQIYAEKKERRCEDMLQRKKERKIFACSDFFQQLNSPPSPLSFGFSLNFDWLTNVGCWKLKCLRPQFPLLSVFPPFAYI